MYVKVVSGFFFFINLKLNKANYAAKKKKKKGFKQKEKDSLISV